MIGYDSLRSGDAYTRQWTASSLVQAMAWSLLGANLVLTSADLFQKKNFDESLI